MEYAILPSVSTQHNSYGTSELLLDIPGQMDSRLDAFESSLWTDLYENSSQLRDGGFAIPPQPTINFQPGPSSLMPIERLENPFFATSQAAAPQQPLSLSEKLFVPQYKNATRGRKRSIDVRNGRSSSKSTTSNVWNTNKKQAVCCSQQWQQQVLEELKEIQRRRVPVRRSQKLSDRITALQKLVSPYGKTDTASVLEEAFISIKVLQDQVQKMFRELTASDTTTVPHDLQKYIYGEKQLDLRSRGLCLVPLSCTQKLTKEEQAGQFATLSWRSEGN